jgi:exosortase/archaeosortase family protein
MIVYYMATTTATMKERFFPWYLRFNADVSVGTLNAFGYDGVSRSGNYLKSARGSVSVERGCDAVEPTALFAAAVLASPVALTAKLPAIVIGALILAVVNVVRIISLFLSAAHWRAAFDILHLDVWQAAFILLALLMWLLWAAWATKRQKRRAGV